MKTKIWRRAISLLLVLLMSLSLLPSAAFATGTDDFYWNNTDQKYHIANVNGLKEFRDSVNGGTPYADKTIVLDANIDLENEEWTPIGIYKYREASNNSGSTVMMDKAFKGIFDGNSKSISNLKISVTNGGKAYMGAGLFGYTTGDAEIKNLTVNNVDVTGRLYVGAVVGYGYTGKEINNCHVTGDIKIEGSWYVGGIGGNGYMTSVKNCSVVGNAGSYIVGSNTVNRDYYSDESSGYIGGIWGFRGEGTNTVESCTVKNVTVQADCNGLGGIQGILHYGNTVKNCTVDSVTLKMYDAVDKEARVGFVTGGNNGTTSEPAYVENCTVTNSTAVAIYGGAEHPVTQQAGACGTDNPAPYYAVKNAAGKYIEGRFASDPSQNTAVGYEAIKDKGVWTIAENGNFYADESGVYHIANAVGLKQFRDRINGGVSYAGKTIVLDADIDLKNVEWEPIMASNIVFDGQNHTISNLKVTKIPTGTLQESNDSAYKYAGFFGAASISTVKNLTIDGANIVGVGYVAAIAGHGLCGCFINCTVKNASITSNADLVYKATEYDGSGNPTAWSTTETLYDNGDKAGAICGYLSGEGTAEVTNCAVIGCTVRGYRDIGGAVGYANESAQVTGNTVKNTTIINDQEHNYKNYTDNSKFDIHEVIGEKVSTAVDSNNTYTDTKVIIAEKKVVVTPGSSTAVNETQTSSVETKSDADKAVKDFAQNDGVKNHTTVTGVKLSDVPTVADTKTGLQAVVDAAKNAVKNDETKTEELKQATKIKVEIAVKIEPVEYTAPDSGETEGKVVFDLNPVATVSVGNNVIAEDIEVTNDMIDQTQPITVTLYTGFQPTQIVHRDDDGKIIEVFNAEDMTYDEATGTVTVIIHHFSTLEAMQEVLKVAKIGGTEYDTLDEAIAQAKSGDTIELLEDCSVAAVPEIGKELTIKFNGKTVTVAGTGAAFAVNCAAGYSIVKVGDVWTIISNSSCKGETKLETVTAGKHILKINGQALGEYTFGKSGSGWTIRCESGKYLALVNGTVQEQTGAFAWNYDGGFYASVSTTVRVLFFWTRTATVKHYLTTDESVSTGYMAAELYDPFQCDEHTVVCRDNGNGTHTYRCSACGDEYGTEDCTYDKATHLCKCGALDPKAAKVSVDVHVYKDSVTKLLLRLFYGKYSYRTVISASCEGADIAVVQYSTDGKNYTTGTGFNSYKDVTSLYVKVITSGGAVSVWYYDGHSTVER